jgi:hypothetical protein
MVESVGPTVLDYPARHLVAMGRAVKPNSPKAQAADELIDLIKSYLK